MGRKMRSLTGGWLDPELPTAKTKATVHAQKAYGLESIGVISQMVR